MLTTPPNVQHISWCFRSQFIFAGQDPKNLTAATMVENLNYCQRTQFSAPIAETQLSACMVQSHIFNCMVRLQFLNTMVGPQMNLFRNLPNSQPSLLGMTSFTLLPHFPSGGFIITIVIVISFAHERKLHQLTTHLNS